MPEPCAILMSMRLDFLSVYVQIFCANRGFFGNNAEPLFEHLFDLYRKSDNFRHPYDKVDRVVKRSR